MCGIAGIYGSDPQEVTPELLLNMTRSIRHRGPDDEGYALFDVSTGRCESRSGDDTVAEHRERMGHLSAPIESPFDLALGHRRLSIIDPSAAGHQPMGNEEGNTWIVHNGEIYNHAELRDELRDRGHRFGSRTDTEVILHSYEEWGTECLNRFNGMWAFAIWDGNSRKLFCSRDRFGIKPFYYYYDGRRFAFASEIKALLEADYIPRRPDNQAIFDYLGYGLEDSAGGTFFSGIRQLEAGHYLEFMPHSKELRVQRYYDVPLRHEEAGLPRAEYARRFYSILEDSIRLRLISDVSLGTCLSGGLDSSSIVCVVNKLMREQGLALPGMNSRQTTFSARFSEQAFDEGLFIDDVVAKTGVNAFRTYPTANGLWEDLPDLIRHQEEPFSRTCVYAQWDVYRLVAQSGVKVALDGQGADELLAGYGIYYAALFSHLARTLQWRKLARECWFDSRLNGKAARRDLVTAAYNLLPVPARKRARQLIGEDNGLCLSKEFAGGFTDFRFRESASGNRGTDFLDRSLRESFAQTILPGLLRHQDRNSMAHSIESRVPFLDYRLVEFAFSMPWDQRIRRGRRKSVLVDAMNGILPESVANRTDKMGFAIPMDSWLRNQLSDKVSEIIHSRSFRERPYLDHRDVEKELKAFLDGRRNTGALIWRWINLELWLRMFIERRGLALT